MIARRLGHSVILLERGTHPRFAIGESSTPLANLLLEQLADRYDLPAIRPLAKWSSWRKAHPEIACGLKRGFTFYNHRFDQLFVDELIEHGNELLVAASPHDGIADTHWYRPDLDHFLVQQAQCAGVEYLDQATVSLSDETEDGALLGITRLGRTCSIRVRLLVDASGPRGFLHRALRLPEKSFPHYPATQALYAHFSDVKRWSARHHPSDPPPYPPDDAAVHHVFDGGWIWILRFANGLTSAGVAAHDQLAQELSLSDGNSAWSRLLDRLPSVRELFANAKLTTPFIHQPRLAFRASIASGRSWIMLPSAVGVVDPLLSTGIALTLLGIERLGAVIEQGLRIESLANELADLGTRTLSELDATAGLIGALYANFHDFEVFSALALLYFAAASFSESARRLGGGEKARSFLLHDDPCFGPALAACCRNALNIQTSAQRTALIDTIHRTIEPFDVAGLGQLDRQNWYPALAEDFLGSAHKLGVSRIAAERALIKSGFQLPDPVQSNGASCPG